MFQLKFYISKAKITEDIAINLANLFGAFLECKVQRRETN